MKIFLKIFLSLIGVIVIIITVIVALIWDAPEKPPTTVPTGTVEELLQEKVTVAVDGFLAYPGSEFSVSIDEEMINNEINARLTEGKDSQYIIEEANFGVVGVWVRFNRRRLTIYGSIHLFLGPIKFKTSIRLEMAVENQYGGIGLRLSAIKIGKVGASWLYNTFNDALEQQNKTIESLIKQAIPIAQYDEASRTARIEYLDFFNYIMGEGSETNAKLAIFFANLVSEQRTLSINAYGGGLSIYVRTNNLDAVIRPNTIWNPITSDLEINELLSDRVLMGVISSFKADQNEMIIPIDYAMINRIIEFKFKEFSEQKITIAGKEYKIVIETPYLTAKTVAGAPALSMNIVFGIQDMNNSSIGYYSSLVADVDIELTGFEKSNLMISFERAIIGSDVYMNDEIIEAILSKFSNVSLIYGHGILITNFSDYIDQSVKFESVTIGRDSLKILARFTTPELNDKLIPIIREITTNEVIINEIEKNLPAIRDYLSDPNDQTLDTIITEYAGLTDKQKNDLLENVIPKLEEAGIDIEDILKLTQQ